MSSLCKVLDSEKYSDQYVASSGSVLGVLKIVPKHMQERIYPTDAVNF